MARCHDKIVDNHHEAHLGGGGLLKECKKFSLNIPGIYEVRKLNIATDKDTDPNLTVSDDLLALGVRVDTLLQI